MNLQGKKIAVTGATGFLGRYIVKALLKHGAKVVAVVRTPDRVPQLKAAGAEIRKADLHDVAALAEGFRGCDAVISNAAIFTISNTDWRQHFETNILGTENVLRAAHQAGIRRIVHVSSVAVYKGRGKTKRIDESTPQHQLQENPRKWLVYSMSKAVSEQKAWEVAKELGLQLTCVRPSAIYGAYDLNATQIFRRLWSRFVSITAPSAVFPLVYGGDVADAVATALEHEHSIGQSYNTAGGPENLGNFYRAWRAAGFPSPKATLPLPLPIRVFYDNSKAEKDLGFSNRPFKEGLAETAQIESQALL